MDESNEPSSRQFYSRWSYYYMLKNSKNTRELAELVKDKEFVENFEANLDKFTFYKEDLRRIFEEAMQFENSSEQIRSRLQTIFDDNLPNGVIKQLSYYLKLEDLPID